MPVFLTIRVVLLSMVFAFAGIAQAELLYSNAARHGLPGVGLITGVRPAGGFFSTVQPPNLSMGFRADGILNAVGDDFVIATRPVLVESIDFYVVLNSSAAQVTGGYVQLIRDNESGPLIALGTFQSSVMTDIYRTPPGSNPVLHLPVRKVRFTFPRTRLNPGTYFLAMQFSGIDPVYPYLTVVGQPSIPDANGRYFSFASGFWGPAAEVGGVQDFPFEVNGTYVDDLPGHLHVLNTVSKVLYEVNPDTGAIFRSIQTAIPSIDQLTYYPPGRCFVGLNRLQSRVLLISEEGEILNSVIASPGMRITGLTYTDDLNKLVCHRVNTLGPIHELDPWTGVTTQSTPNIPITSAVLYMLLRDPLNGVTMMIPSGSPGFFYLYDHLSGANSQVTFFGDQQTGAYDVIRRRVYTVVNSLLLYREFSYPNLGPLIPVGEMQTGNVLPMAYIHEERLAPFQVQIAAGLPFGGDVRSLRWSDNDSFYVLCDENEPLGTVEFDVQHTLSTSFYCRIRVESSASRDEVSEFVELYDWELAQYRLVGARTVPTIDSVASYFIPKLENANPLNGPNGLVKGRIRYVPQTDLESSDGWLMAIDQIRSEISAF